MTIALSILGLGFLIFIHELGHFLVSLALGMRPRRFYIGFPPAIWKTTRNGIEYGLGAIPLGGFVKIPGMHRPAPVDVDIGHRPGRRRGAGCSPAPHERLRSALSPRVTTTPRATAVRVLARARRRARSSTPRADAAAAQEPRRPRRRPRARRVLAGARRGSASPRSRPARRANIVLALVIFTVLYMTSVGKATTTVERVSRELSGSGAGPAAQATASCRSTDTRVAADEISTIISGSEGKPLTVVVVRDGAARHAAGHAPARSTDGAYRLGFVLAGEGLPLPAAAGESFALTGE